MSLMDYCFMTNTKRSESWCSCSLDVANTDLLECNCGEDRKLREWKWEEDELLTNVVLSNYNRDVLFHPIYSSGTAAVRGNTPFQQNIHYYWEIKMLTNLYGTDVMVGIGTSKMVLSDWKLRFCSMLGYNQESWGYSYTGFIQHDRITCSYGPCFTIGSLIGVHLDMFSGTLQYYFNRRPLGIAFRNLKGHELHPMVCSTAAHSAMRITCALSENSNLQIECLKFIGKNPKLVRQLWNTPGVAKMLEKRYFWLVPPPPVEEPPQMDLEDECVLPLEVLNQNYEVRKRFYSGLLVQPRADPDHISYRPHLTP